MRTEPSHHPEEETPTRTLWISRDGYHWEQIDGAYEFDHFDLDQSASADCWVRVVGLYKRHRIVKQLHTLWLKGETWQEYTDRCVAEGFPWTQISYDRRQSFVMDL